MVSIRSSGRTVSGNRASSWLAGLLLLAGVWGATGSRALGAAATAPAPPLPEFPAWVAACRKLPTNLELGARPLPRELLPLKSYAEFEAALEPVLESGRTGAVAQAEAWVGPVPPASFLALDAPVDAESGGVFLPFAQRHAVPAGTRVFFMGDLHGDIHSLLTYLERLNQSGDLVGFKIAKPDVRMVFLGDYTDRGRYGVEVLYTLLRLKAANPTQLHLVRGNHEDLLLVSRYGFLAEVGSKYGRAFDVRRTVRMFDFLPVVFYLGTGTNWVQCNHGGMEPGYNPSRLLAAPASGGGNAFQLIGKLEQRRWLTREAAWAATLPPATRAELERSLVDFLPQSPTTPTVLGFMWNDFTVLPSEPQFAVDPGRAFVYGSDAARRVLAQADGAGGRVRALFRAHQHAGVLNPMMRRLLASRGLYRHWQSTDEASLLEAPPEVLRQRLDAAEERVIPDASVWTFNVSPDSVYGAGCGYTFGTYGELKPAELWEDWRIKVHTFESAGRGRGVGR